eukprot:TRINITY_DN1055_c0_g1_i10.p1 TRINITY_DN1055_c0_g1~~TRINITY_DN1055_c0_g1_i10.p1  ORF type:complete len:410 (-),score=106.64 TRINITY_DN1055_c0_g1_i10:2900-4129(-)
MATNVSINEPTNEFARFDGVATDITNTFQLLINQLIARRDALLRELQLKKENYISKETTRKAALEELTQQIGLLSLKVNENRDLKQQTTNLYKERMKHLQTPTGLPLPFFSCPTLSLLETQIAEFGEIKEWNQDYSLKKRPVLAVGKEGRAKDEIHLPRGLALDEPNQQIYVADCVNNRVQVVSVTGKFLRRFGQGILQSPWGIAVSEDNVYVTDCFLHAVLQFRKKDYELVRRTGTEGEGEGQLNNPRGLCIDYNGDVYVADTWNHRVSVFSKVLDFLKHLFTQQLEYPCDVKVTPSSVVVLDWSPNCVHFFSRSGALLRSCVTHGEKGMVNCPRFFCLDPAGNILITDFYGHNIKILSPSGQLMHTIGKEGHGRGEFKRPSGICVPELETIFVYLWTQILFFIGTPV